MSEEEQKPKKTSITVAGTIANQLPVTRAMESFVQAVLEQSDFQETTSRITALAAKSLNDSLSKILESVAIGALDIARTRMRIIEDATKTQKILENTQFFLDSYTPRWLEEVKKSLAEVTIIRPNNFLEDIAKVTGMTESELGIIEASTEMVSMPVVLPDNTAPEIQSLIENVKQLNEKVAIQQAEIDKLKALQIEDETKRTSVKSKRGANRGTLDKLNRLAEYRQEWINERGTAPGWMASCEAVGIDPKTARRIAPSLREKWEDKNFRWQSD